MPTLRRAIFALFLCLVPSLVLAQADMQITASDSPDPVAPDGNITYTVNVTNAGPSATTTAHLNIVLNGTLLFQSITAPAGWNCGSIPVGYGGSITCTAAVLAVGASPFTIVLNAGKAQFGITDQTINQLFGVNSALADPNNANNNVTVSTAYVTPDSDMSITASDAPDPVFPDGNITYTVNVTNGGPDVTQNARLNIVLNGTLLYQSIVAPAGWSCPALPVGYGASITCTAATFPVSTSQFTVVLKAGAAQFGVNDQTINQLFGVNSDLFDPNNANNNVTVSTAYVTPDSDMSITASDAPDPVAPDGNITYTVNVTNGGPDIAQNARLNVVLNNTLRFQSMVVPAGWSCPALAVGYGASFTCTATTLGLGTSPFTIVLNAGSAQFGINDQTINQLFGVNSDLSDPNNANNNVTVSTAYVTPDSDMSITASDAPDPIAPDGNITYTVNVTNGGPDVAQNARLNVVLNNTLRFQSMVVPAGWSCPALAVGYGASFTCTATTFPVSTSQFTIVLNAGSAQFGINDQTINQLFGVNSDLSDPNNANNNVTVSTLYSTPDADMSVTASDSPDPVTPGQNITWTINVTNGGPDSATNAHMTAPLNANLTFQSIALPAGWSCTQPAIGANGIVDCQVATMAMSTAVFTLVAQVSPALNNGPGGTIQQSFITSNDAQDSAQANNTTQVTTTYTTLTSNLVATNADTPDPVVPGNTITYTQTITNNGPDAAANAKMTQTLPAGVTFQSMVAPGGWSCTTPAIGAGGTINCLIASLPNAGSASFTLVVNVTATSGSVSETVTASSDNFDNIIGNNSATAVTTIDSADLSIAKTTGATSVAPGGTVTYTITIHNAGPSTATSVVMTDTLPASLLFQSIVAPAGFNCTTPAIGATGTITCNGATLTNGANAIFTLTTTIANNAAGSINNSAAVSSATFDPNSGNASGNAPAVAVNNGPSADLSMTKTTQSSGAAPGATITYTLTAHNAGPDAASTVVVTDVLPASLLFQSIVAPAGFNCTTPAIGASGTITCNGATLANGANATFTLTVRVAANASGSITNGASISSATGDPNGGNGSGSAAPVTVLPPSIDLSLTKTTLSTSVTTGSTISYTITVANAGPSTATNVTMTDVLPAGLQFVSAVPSQGSCSGTTTVTCSLGSILSGANATITLQAQVTSNSGSITNSATVSGTETDSNPGNNGGSSPAVPVGEPIPALSMWALIAMAIVLGGVALLRMK
jgi:uncharacterized repeat protein (TIGR01451 family)